MALPSSLMLISLHISLYKHCTPFHLIQNSSTEILFGKSLFAGTHKCQINGGPNKQGDWKKFKIIINGGSK